ncbi:hypothetical protein H6G41_12745 [Tolypothrix sp. FACHB-123]|uniref:hypothetical protein n=1 Tax=Tolypothrix sp. FACHB-123 TaxID=2692868 RepID=UPI0016878E89|nr:hypothetical protein [Tolypothrix sp. FACHB-123]MBD2355470.1 hypothetical protein [Tolypothrix sp. FACHB-123]
MPRQKKTSSVLKKTEQQTIGFKSIDPNLDFGDSISLKQLTELTKELREELNQYNYLLNTLDLAKAKIETIEKSIRQTSERLVSGVVFKYGKDSREYEMLGRVRTSDRVRKAIITRLKTKAEATKAASTKTV